MTKVEELRDRLYRNATENVRSVASAWGHTEYMTEREIRSIGADLDSLISAAHAEGFARGAAEGTEQERMRIWMERDHVPQVPIERCVIIPVSAFAPTASVLAPTKETPCSG